MYKRQPSGNPAQFFIAIYLIGVAATGMITLSAYFLAFAPLEMCIRDRFWGEYSYDGKSIYANATPDDPPLRNRDRAQAEWWGSEVKLVTAWSERNKLVSGLEYQSNYRQKQWNYDVNPYQTYLDDLRDSWRGGVFVQNDFQWTDSLKISLGARYDKIGTATGEFSPVSYTHLDVYKRQTQGRLRFPWLSQGARRLRTDPDQAACRGLPHFTFV